MTEQNSTGQLLYAVDEQPPHKLAISLGAQTVALTLAAITLTPIIALSAAGESGPLVDWVVFAALAISGLATVLQSRRVGPIGAGYILFMGTSGAFLAVTISAVEAGGVQLLATLVLASSLVQFAFSRWLSVFRRIITPVVGGTVICLIAVTIMPIGFSMVSDVPAGLDVSPNNPAIVSLATLAVILAISFFAVGKIRLWAPLLGIVSGYLVAWPLGLVDGSKIVEASWVGLPSAGWPGLDLSFSREFWLLLPAFFIVTIIGALETFGDSVAIQEVSHRSEKPRDYRVVQGALNADGVGNLVSGLSGTMPNTTYSTSVALVGLTGVAARQVGMYGGLILFSLAFIPKLSALLQSIPAPVAGAFLVVMLALLFASGVRLIFSRGLSFDNGIVFALSLWIGIGFQNSQLFDGLLPTYWADLLNNGMTSGGISAIFLSWLVSLKGARPKRFKTRLEPTAVKPLLNFVRDASIRQGWRGEDLNRLVLATEEAFTFLLHCNTIGVAEMQLSLRPTGSSVELEMITAPSGANVEELMAELGPADGKEEEISLRLLRHITDELNHQQFSQADFLSLTLYRNRPAREQVA